MLGEVTKLPFVGGNPDLILAVINHPSANFHMAGHRVQESGDRPEGARFTGAGRAEQHQDLAGGDLPFWVSPVRFPANIMVAPNSESARAQARPSPVSMAGLANGSVTLKKVRHGETPKVWAMSS